MQAISAHAERTYPEECCGLLLGRLDKRKPPDNPVGSDHTANVVEVRATKNAWSAETAVAMQELIAPHSDLLLDKTRRYWIDPQDLLAGQRYARSHNLDIIGIYHSHTDHSAIPSECDRACAWPQYSYLIASVCQGRTQDFRCWSLDEAHQFQAETISTVISCQP